MYTKTLLYVDDDDVLRGHLSRAFIARGLQVVTAASVDEATKHLDSICPDMALVDLKMPGKSGMELLKELGHRMLKDEEEYTCVKSLYCIGLFGNRVCKSRIKI